MSIIYEYDECPSFMNEMNVHHVWHAHVLNSGCPSYLMYYSHKCPSYMWTSFVMEPMESFSRRNKLKRYGELEVHMQLMESELREYREYGTGWINGTGDRKSMDQGLDWIEGKDWNEGIRTMALMEFMKFMEPTQLMERLIFMMKLMEPMKMIGYVFSSLM